MKFLRILFLINTLIVLIFLALIFSTESKTSLTAELTTEIPEPAVFKLIVKKLTESEIRPDQTERSIIRFTYFQNEQPVPVTYQLKLDDKHFKIFFIPVQEKATVIALKNSLHQITLNKLVDGTTNIQWQFQYEVPGWTARLLNRFFWKPALEKFLDKQMSELRQALAS